MNISPALKRFIPPVISLALFMEALDTTIINTAIPAMSKSLNTDPIDLKIALISYLLSLAVFTPISGWLADKFGMKKVFISAIALFTLSSFACGFSYHLWELVIARIFQGLGGALMMPIGRLMMVRCFERTELIQTMNRVVILALLGPALGPFLGGWLTEAFSWRWIFWVNIPFGIMNILLALHLLPEYRPDNVHKLDKIGFLLFGMGLAGLTFGLSLLSEEALSLSLATGIILGSLSLLTLYIFHAKYQVHPILNNALFGLHTFRISIIGNIFTRLGIGAFPFLLPLMLQLTLNYSPKEAGMITACFAAGAMLTKTFSKHVLTYMGFKHLLIMNTVILGLSLMLFTFTSTHTPSSIIIGYTLLSGIFTSLQYSAMNPLVFAQTTPAELSSASSIHSVTLQISQSFGVALCALILRKFQHLSGETTLNLQAFHHTFLVAGVITMLSSVVFLFLKKDDGSNLIR